MFKSALVFTTAAAIALSCADLRPAAAAPQAAPALAKHSAVELSAVRKKRRHYGHGGFPLAAFGMLAGTIASIAAAENARANYPVYYGEGPYGDPNVYAEPQDYYADPGYVGPGYVPRAHYGPRIHNRAYGGTPRAINRSFAQRSFNRGPAQAARVHAGPRVVAPVGR